MKKQLSLMSFQCALMIIVPTLLGCALAGAQTQARDKYIISAKAGKINALSGKATVQHMGTSAWQALSSKDDLDSGDALRTEANGRVELLLNPGSYLRLAENSELELTDTSLDNLRFNLRRGSAIVEATGTDGTRLLAQINTPQTKILIDRNGLYRFNVSPGATTEVLVYKGKALVGSKTLAAIKGGSKISIDGSASGDASIAKLDKRNMDEFDFWSRHRASALAQANRSLTQRTMTGVLASFRDNGAFGYGSAPYFGLWVFNGALDGYTFLPFYSSWSSPYGLGYRNGFGLPWYYNQPNPPGSLIVTNPGGGGNHVVIVNPNPPVAGTPDAPPDQQNPRRPHDPIGDKPLRPFPVERDESATRFDRAFGGGGGNAAPNAGVFNSGSNSGSSAPVREQPQSVEMTRPSAPVNVVRPDQP